MNAHACVFRPTVEGDVWCVVCGRRTDDFHIVHGAICAYDTCPCRPTTPAQEG